MQSSRATYTEYRNKLLLMREGFTRVDGTKGLNNGRLVEVLPVAVQQF